MLKKKLRVQSRVTKESTWSFRALIYDLCVICICVCEYVYVCVYVWLYVCMSLPTLSCAEIGGGILLLPCSASIPWDRVSQLPLAHHFLVQRPGQEVCSPTVGVTNAQTTFSSCMGTANLNLDPHACATSASIQQAFSFLSCQRWLLKYILKIHTIFIKILYNFFFEMKKADANVSSLMSAD